MDTSAVRRTRTTHFAGLDVSLKDISVCVVDEAGHVVLRGSVQSEPAAVADFLATRHVAPERIVHESGQLSIWLQRGLVRLGLPAVCIDARIAEKALSARVNKSDAADAEGLAHLARTGWYTPVHVRSENADRVRTLIAARKRLIRLRKDLEGHVRGALKTFGIRMTAIGQGRHRDADALEERHRIQMDEGGHCLIAFPPPGGGERSPDGTEAGRSRKGQHDPANDIRRRSATGRHHEASTIEHRPLREP